MLNETSPQKEKQNNPLPNQTHPHWTDWKLFDMKSKLE